MLAISIRHHPTVCLLNPMARILSYVPNDASRWKTSRGTMPVDRWSVMLLLGWLYVEPYMSFTNWAKKARTRHQVSTLGIRMIIAIVIKSLSGGRRWACHHRKVGSSRMQWMCPCEANCWNQLLPSSYLCYRRWNGGNRQQWSSRCHIRHCNPVRGIRQYQGWMKPKAIPNHRPGPFQGRQKRQETVHRGCHAPFFRNTRWQSKPFKNDTQ